MKLLSRILASALVAILSGCSMSADCDSSSAIGLVEEIALKKLNGANKFMSMFGPSGSKEIEFSLDLHGIQMLKHDKKQNQYACSATLDVTTENIGKKRTHHITYTVENRSSSGEVYVNLIGF